MTTKLGKQVYLEFLTQMRLIKLATPSRAEFGLKHQQEALIHFRMILRILMTLIFRDFLKKIKLF